MGEKVAGRKHVDRQLSLLVTVSLFSYKFQHLHTKILKYFISKNSSGVYFTYTLAAVLNSILKMKSLSVVSSPYLRLLTDPVFNVGSAFAKGKCYMLKFFLRLHPDFV